MIAGGELGDVSLSREQIEHFLDQQGRSAETLLAASHLAGSDYLQEAAEKFPDAPMVRFELAMKAGTPEEQRAALDRFRQTDPNNALGDLLSASLAFKQGDREQAARDLELALSHSRFESYGKIIGLQMEAAYSSAGYGEVDARALGTFGIAAPELMTVRNISEGAVAAREALANSGDPEGGERLAEAAWKASQRIQSESKTLISELVGLSMETKLLKASDPDKVWPDGRTTSQLLAATTERKEAVSQLVRESKQRMDGLSDDDLFLYLAKARESGEQRAMDDLAAGQR